MESARIQLEQLFNQVVAKDPVVKLLSNRDGRPVSSGAEYVRALLSQVSSPVRWDKCMETMQGASMVVEAAPSGVLSNLVKKTIAGAEVYSLKSPDQSIDLADND
jgi:[acyl-carrier-protein] S-malonyltransferase